MAIIRILPTSRYWIAQFATQRPDGSWKTTCRSTKIHITPPPGSKQTARQLRETAQEIANTYERTAKKHITPTHIRRVLTELSKHTITLPSVRQWIQERLAIIAKQKKASTYRNYKESTDLFFQYLADRDTLPLDSITILMMDEFHQYLTARYRTTTAKKHFSSVRHFFITAKHLNILDSDPCEAVTALASHAKSVPSEDEHRRPFTLPELQLILSHANDEWRSLILTSLYTGGQRLGDIATLRWDSINFTKNTLTITTQKRAKHLIIPLWPRLRTHLEQRYQHRTSDEYVHPYAAEKHRKTGKSSTLSNEFGKILYLCGLIERNPTIAGKQYKKQYGTSQDKTRHKNPLSFHSLRYTATTLLHEAGVPPLLVQKIVGHDSAKIHEGYAAFSLAESSAAFSRLPEL